MRRNTSKAYVVTGLGKKARRDARKRALNSGWGGSGIISDEELAEFLEWEKEGCKLKEIQKGFQASSPGFVVKSADTVKPVSLIDSMKKKLGITVKGSSTQSNFGAGIQPLKQNTQVQTTLPLGVPASTVQAPVVSGTNVGTTAIGGRTMTMIERIAASNVAMRINGNRQQTEAPHPVAFHGSSVGTGTVSPSTGGSTVNPVVTVTTGSQQNGGNVNMQQQGKQVPQQQQNQIAVAGSAQQQNAVEYFVEQFVAATKFVTKVAALLLIGGICGFSYCLYYQARSPQDSPDGFTQVKTGVRPRESVDNWGPHGSQQRQPQANDGRYGGYYQQEQVNAPALQPPKLNDISVENEVQRKPVVNLAPPRYSDINIGEQQQPQQVEPPKPMVQPQQTPTPSYNYYRQPTPAVPQYQQQTLPQQPQQGNSRHY